MQTAMPTLALLALLVASGGYANEFKLTRTSKGVPDLTGFYDGGTLTPLNRPQEFGDKRYLTRAEADAVAARAAAEFAESDSDPERGPPQTGGDGRQQYGAGGVGGYNTFYVDRGTAMDEIDGKIPTSIIYDPPNGRQPPMTPAARKKAADNASSFIYHNDGTASWLAKGGHGPFDGPEDLALAERCIMGFTSGAPSLPSLYNNYRRIIQTESHVMILLEMVHDARVIRLNAEHGPADNRRWLGDSVGHWEGDTLVVDTVNFRSRSPLSGADENLHVLERFTPQDNGDILYDFTVTDPTAWTAPWRGQFVWKRSAERVYEYACHEGNYAMGNILRGARLLEKEWIEERGSE
ncbi:MAG: hypothetical protein P8Y69_01890 [Gammaproteobacteria bacterium]|jgi:hypothetical protein